MVKNIVFDIGRVLVDYDWESYLDSFGFSPEVRARVLRVMCRVESDGKRSAYCT